MDTASVLQVIMRAGRTGVRMHRAMRQPRQKMQQVQHTLHPKRKEEHTMKKSGLIAVIVFLAAAVGALAAAYMYLQRREKELDEYERLLFSEDGTDGYVAAAGDTDVTAEAPATAE